MKTRKSAAGRAADLRPASAVTKPATVVPILMYHSVVDGATTRWGRYTVTPEQFSRQLALLRSRDLTPISAADLARARAGAAVLPPKPVLLTFDDGHGDFLSAAAPLLLEHGFTATVYLTTSLMGGRSPWPHRTGAPGNPMLTWEQAREASSLGFEVGAHGVTHQQLDTLPAALASREIVESKKQIEDRISKPVVTFCYPHGASDATVRRLVEAAGYVNACSTVCALSGTEDDAFALARIPVLNDTTEVELAWMLATLPLAPLPERLRTRVWRVARRQIATIRRARWSSGRDA